ncbi:ISL3 family transposase [uncultured Nitrospira sp.]|uniref:ISL3 family transposase n=1 Tax=uncultured Nitrospira sp. TaxID=157176 RepID=UPI003140C8CB
MSWLANHPFSTKRLAGYVGRRCRETRVKELARELKLNWKTVKSLEKAYMREQLRRTGSPGPKAIGIDEISIKKGHTYRMVVSDLMRRWTIWFERVYRSKQSMDLFYQWLEERKAAGMRLAVMDMWRATMKHAPQAAILDDKFHVMRRLGKALDTVRKQEYKRLTEKDRSWIKGQKYTLLSRKANLTLEGHRALNKLLGANKRLHTAYLLKEAFGQLWEYQTEGWARKFFENWKASLKWQRLKPYEEFAEMLERHWDGIAAYSKAENKVSFGLVEEVNNKIGMIQRRGYRFHDEEDLRLKVLPCMLKPV